MGIPPIPKSSVLRFLEYLDAAAFKVTGRNRYLESVKDSQRLELMRLRDENLRLRFLARIAPDAEVPRFSQEAK
jgi:hypothetical protein